MNHFPAANDAEASIEKVLVFVTGASGPPPQGFDEPTTITFLDDDPLQWPIHARIRLGFLAAIQSMKNSNERWILRLKIPHALDTLEQYTLGMLFVLIDNKCARLNLKYYIDVRNNCS